MPAILRHPRFADPVPGYLAEAAAIDLDDELTPTPVWQTRSMRRWNYIVEAVTFAAALAMVGGVVVALWLAKAWG